MSDAQRFNEEVQRVGKNGFDAAVSSFGEVNKGFQAIAAEVTDLLEEVIRGRYPCFRAAACCKVIAAGFRDPVSVRQNGL